MAAAPTFNCSAKDNYLKVLRNHQVIFGSDYALNIILIPFKLFQLSKVVDYFQGFYMSENTNSIIFF